MPFNAAEVLTGSASQLVQATDFLSDYRARIIATIKTKAEAIRDRANLGDFGADVTLAGKNAVLALNKSYTEELVRQLDPVFNNVLRLAGRPGGNPESNWGVIYKYLQENTLTFLKRGPQYADFSTDITTSGKGSSSSIVGDSTLYQLLVDRYGNDLDGGNGDITYTIKCVKNQANGGTKYAEEFEVSSDSSLTIFDRGPSGEGFPLIVPNDGGGILSKPSFKIGNAENLNPTSLGPWEQPSGDYSNFDLVITPTYRRGKGETNSNQNPVAVRFNDEDILQQVLSKDLTRSIPLLPGLSIYRENDCDRLVSIRVGNKTILDSYDVSTQTNETWAQAVGILDENLFLDNSEPVDKTNKDLFYEIEVHGGTTGEVVFDNAFLLKGTPLNGRWIFMVPGQIAHALDDQFQFTDEAPTTNGKHAQVILDRYGRHVPTVSSSPAVPEP